MLLLPLFAMAQGEAVITGNVTDAAGNALTGANIYIAGTIYGAVSARTGEYVINVPGTAARGQEVDLIVSYMGYKTKKETVTLSAGTLQQDFVLETDVLQMSAVVVTGMNVGVEKERLGVSIGKVRGEDVAASDESNIVSALYGKVANVEITTNSGDPGAATYIRIRGGHSVTGGSQPLFVVDGSPIDNTSVFGANDAGHGGVMEQNRAADINPEDIESIEILKGAAASAIYGSRAANGVVLITTKSGKVGKPSLSYKMSYSFDEVNKLPDLQTRWGQGIDGVSVPGYPFSYGPKLDASVPTYDHAGEMFETGHTFENTLTLSGGNEWTTYYMSLSQSDVDGAIKGNSDYKRNSVRLKASQRVNEKLNVTAGLTLAKTFSNRIQKGSNVSGLMLGAWRTPPDFNNLPYLDPVTGLHRSYRYPSAAVLTANRGYDNPFFVVNEHVNTSDVGRGFGNVNVVYDPFDWMSVSYTLGHDFWTDERRTVLPPSSSSAPMGQIIREKYNNAETDGLLTVTTNHTFKPAGLQLTTMLGHQWNIRTYNGFETIGDQMGVYTFHQLENTVSYAPSEYEEEVRDEALFGQVMAYMFDQLSISGALRYDGSSTFSQDQQRFWYPKVSGAWEFTKQAPFRKINNWLSFGKLRGGFGVAGKQPEAYSMVTAFSSGAITDGYIREEGLKPTYLGYSGFWSSVVKGQDKIKPERTEEIEVGVDLAFLNNRVGLDVTYYEQNTTDAILTFPISMMTGYAYQVRNAGTITNKGWEVEFSAQPVSKKDFVWDLSLIWARNRNMVNLAGADDLLLGGFFNGACYAADGYPLGVIRALDYVRFGLGNTINGENIDELYAGQWKPGDMYIAEDGLPREDPQERIIGDPNPDWTGSVRTEVTLFGKLKVSALVDIKQGGDVWNGTKGALYYFGTHKDTDVEAVDADGVLRRGSWKTFDGVGPGAGTAVFLDQDNWYAFGLGNHFYGPGAPALEDGSYVKLREIAVTYKFAHPSIKRWTGLSDIDIRLSGRNLATWTNYTGIDPETNLAGNAGWRGLDYFNNPMTRSYVVTLRLNY